MSESGILQRARQSLQSIGRTNLVVGVAPPIGVVAGFSGGVDSTALIVVLGELERLGLLRLTAVHVDHGMRPASSTEVEVVSRSAARLGVTFCGVALDPDAVSRHRGVGIEEAMRRERYRALASVATDLGAPVVATGHHRGDQAETVLLHLLRGSGLRGASGMREVSEIVVPWWEDAADPHRLLLWRPLLAESPGELRAIVAPLGLEIVEDPSNQSEDYRRNALRHRVLPLIEEIMPGAEANLAAFAQRVADDDAALDTLAKKALRDVEDRLERSLLVNHPVAIQRRVLRRWVAGNAPGLELTFDRTEAMRELVVRNEGGKAVEIGDGWRVLLRRGVLVLEAPRTRD